MSIAILHTDLVKDGTVSTDGGTTQNSITKVQNVKLFDKVIGPSADYDWSIDTDFGEDVTIQAIAVLGLNMTNNGLLNLTFDDDAAFTSPNISTFSMAFDNTYSRPGEWLPREGKTFVFLTDDPRSDSGVTAQTWTDRYLRVGLVNSTNPPSEGWIELSLLWACSVIVPTYGAQVVDFDDEIGPGGKVIRSVKIKFTLTRQEESELRNLYRGLGGRGRVILHPTTDNIADEIGTAMLCTIDSLKSSSRDASEDPQMLYREVTATFMEAPY